MRWTEGARGVRCTDSFFDSLRRIPERRIPAIVMMMYKYMESGSDVSIIAPATLLRVQGSAQIQFRVYSEVRVYF